MQKQTLSVFQNKTDLQLQTLKLNVILTFIELKRLQKLF